MIFKEKCQQLDTLEMTGTKWDFFVVAIELFSTKGYTNVSIREIAQALNVKAASMYNHFESKDELLAKIFEFFLVNYEATLPDLEELLRQVTKLPPGQVLGRLQVRFGDNMQALMSKIINIIFEERNRDPRARKLMDTVFMEVPRRYLKAVLGEMMVQEVIEPLDIESLAILFTSLDFYASYVYDGKFALNQQDWEHCHQFLLQSVRKKC